MDRFSAGFWTVFQLTNTDKAKISSLLKHKSIINPESVITLTNNVSKEENGIIYVNAKKFVEDFPHNIVDRANMVLRSMEKLTTFAGEELNFNNKERTVLGIDSFSQQSVDYMKGFLESRHLLGFPPNILGNFSTYITPKGWEHLDSLKYRSTKDEKNVFVAMWFHEEMSIIDAVISKVIISCGYRPIRIDREEHNNKIDDEIIASINKSKFVICDFTGHRGGVYFEAGYAKGIGLPVIWTCKDNDVDGLHFDTRQYNHILWNDGDDLDVKLTNRIKATIID